MCLALNRLVMELDIDLYQKGNLFNLILSVVFGKETKYENVNSKVQNVN